MSNARDYGRGFGLRLTRAQLRRLEELARVTGRSPAGVVCRLIEATSPRDPEAVERIRSTFAVDNILNGGDADVEL